MEQVKFEPTLQNILDQESLKWIFVGGKGGVGKTTTSSSLATLLAQSGRKTLIISTDPAHNLSDCFDQKFGKNPVKVNGIENLFAMEIDPKIDPNKIQFPSFQGFEIQQMDEATQSFLSEIMNSVPGIDEAMSFAELVNSLEKMDYSTIIFDTAPTGHTLRLLNFPNLLNKGLNKIITLKQKFGNLLGSLEGIVGSKNQMEEAYEKVFGSLEKMKIVVEKVNEQMMDPEKTTFVAVCIAEFLSMYETERLVQELAKFNIDIHNVVINQVLYPDGNCKMCNSRCKMQKKYIDQILELYDDFNLTIVPQQNNEIRGIQDLSKFCKLLLTPRQPPQLFE